MEHPETSEPQFPIESLKGIALVTAALREYTNDDLVQANSDVVKIKESVSPFSATNSNNVFIINGEITKIIQKIRCEIGSSEGDDQRIGLLFIIERALLNILIDFYRAALDQSEIKLSAVRDIPGVRKKLEQLFRT